MICISVTAPAGCCLPCTCRVPGGLRCPAVLSVCLTAVRLSFQIFCCYFVSQAIARLTASRSLSRGPCLFHAAPQHLIGRDKHDADDEGDGESAYQALAHARLFDLLRRAGTCRRGRGRALLAGPSDEAVVAGRRFPIASEWESSSQNLTFAWPRYN